MAPNLLRRIGQVALWLAPIIIGAGFIALWWLSETIPATAAVLRPVVAISLMAYVSFISYRQRRRLDEVQIARQDFASTHGWAKGTLVAVLLLMFPPFTDWLVDLVNIQSTGSPTLSDPRAVRLAFGYGACLVVALQGLGWLVASAIWWRRMRGTGERS
jgi:hypothetical protein